MAAIGMTEAQAASIAAQHKADTAAAAAAAAAAAKAAGEPGGGMDGEMDFSALSLFDSEDPAAVSQPAASEQPGSASKGGMGTKDGTEACEAQPQEDLEQDWVPGFDLFGDSGPGLDALPCKASGSKQAPAAEEEILPWGAEGAGGRQVDKSGSRRAKKKPVPPSTSTSQQQPQPRALLSQECKQAGWQQPRYSKLPAAVAGQAGGGTVRYSVTVDMGVARGAAAKRRGWGGSRTFQVPVDDDGWPDVQVRSLSA